jgi:hypothetical protein
LLYRILIWSDPKKTTPKRPTRKRPPKRVPVSRKTEDGIEILTVEDFLRELWDGSLF